MGKGAKATQKKGTGKPRFAGLPHVVMDHPDYIGLSCGARALLLELARQYNGYNNGDLTAAFSIMRDRGITKSKTTLAKLIKELIDARMIEIARHHQFLNPGGVCALYYLAWEPRHECPGKNLLQGPSTKPIRAFSLEKAKTPSP